MRLKDKRILITDGRAESGQRMAQAFAGEGAQVIVNLWPKDADVALPQGVHIVFADPTDPGAVRVAVHEAHAPAGRLDVMVHNNNEIEPMTLEGATDEQMERALSVNARSAFFFAQAAGILMRAQQGAKILFLSSIHGEKPTGSALGYSIAKGAVQMLSREIALDLGGYQVQSLLVEIGAMPGDDQRFSSEITPLYDDYLDKIPGHALNDWDAVTRLMVFVASDACTVFNGETLRADRGFVLHYHPRSTYEEQGVEV